MEAKAAVNATEKQVPQDVYTDAQAKAVAGIIHEATASSDLALRALVGETVVVQPPYESLEEWNKRNTGAQSLEKVAAKLLELDPDTRWSSGKIYDCVRFYEQTVMIGAPGNWPKLLYSHYRAVQGLGWDRQRELLDRAQAERLTAKALEKLIVSARNSVRPIEPRPVASTAARLLKRLAEVVDDRDALASELGREGVSSDEITALWDDLARVEARISALQQKLASTASPA